MDNDLAGQRIEALMTSGKLEGLLLDNADEVLYFYSMGGKLIYVNDAFEVVTGYAKEELFAKNFIPFVHPDDQDWTRKLWEGLYRGEFFENVEYRIVRKDGASRWSLSTWKILVDATGQQIGIQGKQQDVTGRKSLEQERLALIESLQSALHEIKVLKGIIPICSYCHKMRNEDGIWKQLEEYIGSHSGAKFSHGICPTCLPKTVKELGPSGKE